MSSRRKERDVDPQRVARAAAALEDGTAHVEPTGPGEYRVRSFTSNAVYTVDMDRRECDCPDALYRGERCKHLYAVALVRGLS